jgi:hypothetical protein
MSAASATEQDADRDWEGSLDLTVSLVGRRVGFVLRYRDARGIRRVLRWLALVTLPITAVEFWSWSTLTHSASRAAAITAASTVACTAASALLAFVTVVVGRRMRSKWTSAWFSAFSARGLTDLAVFLAGRKRQALRGEWHAHLGGESGHDPVTWQKVGDACGFVYAAAQCRLGDVAEAAWTPADTILKSRKLSNLLVFGPTVAAAVFILRHHGALGVLTSAESIIAIGGCLYTLVRVGRWWRDVKPPEPKARRTARS